MIQEHTSLENSQKTGNIEFTESKNETYEALYEMTINSADVPERLKMILTELNRASPEDALKNAQNLYHLMRIKNCVRAESWNIYLYEQIKHHQIDWYIKKNVSDFNNADPVEALKDAEHLCVLMEKRLDEYLFEKRFVDHIRWKH